MAKQDDPQDNERIKSLDRSLTNVSPDDEQIARIMRVRDAAKILGAAIILTGNNSRERSLALTHLEEATMWAVKGIVLNG